MTSSVIVSRIFNAPLEAVWKVWTDPELVKQWWVPDKFTCPSAVIDFREGEISLVCMRAPIDFGGQDTYCTWTYTKIVLHQSIEFIQHLADKN